MANFTEQQIKAAIKKGMDEFDRLYGENIGQLGAYSELTGMKWALNGFVTLRLKCCFAIDEGKANEIPGFIADAKDRRFSPGIDPLYQQAFLEIEKELGISSRTQRREGRSP